MGWKFNGFTFFVSNENCNVKLTFEAHDDIIESLNSYNVHKRKLQ